MSKKKKQGRPMRPTDMEGNYGIELGMMSTFSWINLPASAFFLLATWLHEYDKISRPVLLVLFTFCVLISVVGLILSHLKTVQQRFPVFSYLLYACTAFVTIVWFDFLILTEQISKNEPVPSVDFSQNDVLSCLIPMLILFVIGISIFYVYHKNLTVLKLSNGKVVAGQASFGLIFTVVLFVRNIFEGNTAFNDFLGIFMEFIMNVLFPGVAMGAIFTAVAIKKARKETLKQ